MRVITCLILLFVLSSVAVCAASSKITLDARDMKLSDVAAEFSKQTGISLTIDPKVSGTLTASLQDFDITAALDIIAATTNSMWRKFQFARKEDSPVTLDQLKSTAMTLASVQVAALAMEDPVAKTSTIVAKNLASSPDVSSLKLPEGYSWLTIYTLLPKDAFIEKSKTEEKPTIASLTEIETKRMEELAKMTTEERQQIYTNEWVASMGLAEDQRRALLKDRMTAMFNLDPEYRSIMQEDMHAIGESMRESGQVHFGGRRGDNE